jgi:hypothetical protein
MKIHTLLLALALALCGCAKFTNVRHTWPDGAVSEITDKRVNMKSEAQFVFEQDTNGIKRISAGVRSGADAEAAYQLIGAGVSILKAAQ